jgi:hypothetical protein
MPDPPKSPLDPYGPPHEEDIGRREGGDYTREELEILKKASERAPEPPTEPIATEHLEPPFDLSRFDPSSLDLSHLDQRERNRIKARQYEPRELSLLLQWQNPWTKSGKPKPLPRKPEPPELPDDLREMLGIPRTVKEKRDAELLAFMPPQLRTEFNKADAKHKAALWEANERNFEAARKREEQRLRRYQEKTEKTLDMLHSIREDSTKAHLLPPDDASMDELHKWYEKMSQPVRNIPFPGEGGQPATDPPGTLGKQAEETNRPNSKPESTPDFERYNPFEILHEAERLRKREEILKREERLQSRRESEEKQRSLDSFTRSLGFDTAFGESNIQRDTKPIEREFPGPPNHTQSVPLAKEPDPKSKSWIHRIPVWKEFGAWLKWASACFAFALTMTQINEYGWALVGLLACGGCCLAQLYVWTASPNRFKNGVAKCFLAFLSLGIILIGMMTVIRIKGERQWSNLLQNKPQASPMPTPSQNPSPALSIQQLASPEPPTTILEDPQYEVISDQIGVPTRAGGKTLYPQMQLEYNYRADSFRLAVYVGSTDFTAEVCIRLLEKYPRLKTTMVRHVEQSSEAWQGLNIKALLIVYKGRLTKEQIKEIERHAKKLKIGLILEGPSSP